MYDTISHNTVFLLGLVYCGSFRLKDISWRLQRLACLVKRESAKEHLETSTGSKKRVMVERNMTIAGNIVLAVFLALLSLPSCKSRPDLVIHQSDTLSVVIRELPAGYPPIMPVHHPCTIRPEAIIDILESLTYDAGTLLPFANARPRRVFTKPQAERLAAELSKALSLAPPDRVSAFTIADVEKPDRLTTGFVFMLNDEMHLIIEHLRQPQYEGEQNTYQQPVSNWKLRPTGNQRLYARHLNGKGEMTNWISSPLR